MSLCAVCVNVAGQRFYYVQLLPSARVAKFQRCTDQQRQDYPESARIKPEFGFFWTRQHTPWLSAAYLRLVCRTETKEKLIDVKLSNIRSSPHHVVIRKNEQWIEQNVVFSSRQNTHIGISGRRGEAGAFVGVAHARVSNLHPRALATSAMTPWTRRLLPRLWRRRLKSRRVSLNSAKHEYM